MPRVSGTVYGIEGLIDHRENSTIAFTPHPHCNSLVPLFLSTINLKFHKRQLSNIPLRIQKVPGSYISTMHRHSSDFHGTSQALQADAGILTHISLWPPSSTTFPIHYSLIILPLDIKRRDSVVGIETGYRLDDQGVRVRVQLGQKFSLLYIVQTSCGSTQPPIQWVPGALSLGGGGKVAGAWSWPLTSS
jgi:hypothetical protein